MMSMMVSFCAVLFPCDVLDEILDLFESVSEGFPTYSHKDVPQVAQRNLSIGALIRYRSSSFTEIRYPVLPFIDHSGLKDRLGEKRGEGRGADIEWFSL